MSALHNDSTLQGGKYIVKKVLGQGGFGITYLAYQPMLNREVAIKEFFYKELCNRSENDSTVTIVSKGGEDTVRKFLKKFIKEARTIASLKHPNIIKVHDVFEENGTAYYVMDYIEGETFAQIIKDQGKISEPLAVKYILQVASALSYIHSQNINHLDIKPGNLILRQKDDQVIVIDFGMAKHYDVTTGDGTTTTPIGISSGFAPLEQYRQGGVSSFSPESDIYSLGATLYKLVTGITPPEASQILEDGGIGQIECVSASVANAISESMQTSKSKRPHSIGDFISIITADESHLTDSNMENDDSDIEAPSEMNLEDGSQASPDIRWDPDDPKRLNLHWHSSINLIYKGVLFGSLLTILFGVVEGINQYMQCGSILTLLLVVPSVLLGILGLIGAAGIVKRKPNSVFHCLIYSWICTLSNLLSAIISLANGQFPGILIFVWLAYGIYIVCSLHSSDEVNLIFPKDYRKISIGDQLLAGVCISSELLILFLILVGLFT